MDLQTISVFSIFVCVINLCHGCSLAPPNYRHWSMERVLFWSDIVVYGKEVSRFTHITTNANFEVFCILKDTSPSSNIAANITIEEVAPRDSCSATEVQSGAHIILALQRLESGNFVWHEAHVLDSASYDATSDNLNTAVSVCGLQQVALPTDYSSDSANPTCPSVPMDVTCYSGRGATHRHLLVTVITVFIHISAILLLDSCTKLGIV